jgi:hypothetical protein
MSSILNFDTKNFLNWQILVFVLVQTILSFNLNKSSNLSKIIMFIYTFLIFAYIIPCPIEVWFADKNRQFYVTLFIIFIYSTYTSFGSFYYPRKKYSYIVFQFFANLFVFYLFFFFFYLFFCKNYSDLSPDLPDIFR